MTKEEHISYWIQTSDDDYGVFKVLLLNKNYSHALFIAHLCLEKLIKAHWVKDNENNVPPKVHNLVYLVKQSKLVLSEEQINFLSVFNDFQIQGRYPDYKFRIKQLLTDEFVYQIVKQFEEVRSWIIKKIS